MLNYDLHIHTEYCGHAKGMTVAAICARADELKLNTIAITDHIYSPKEVPVIDRIKKEVADLKPLCRVIVGAEVDVDGKYDDGRFVTDAFDGIDYIVAGFHYVPGEGNYPFTPDDCPLSGDEFMARWERALIGIVSNPKVNTLAHPARLLISSVDLEHYFDDALAIFARAAKISARNKINWEINELTGSRLNDYWKSRWHEIYKVALDAGVKIVYGSDAHNPANIAVDTFTQSVLKKLPPNSLTFPKDAIKIKT